MRKIKDKIISIMLAVVFVVTSMTVSVNAKEYQSLPIDSYAAAAASVQNLIPIDAQHFPDPEFRKYLSGLDEDKDGYLNVADVTDLNLWNEPNIANLAGIEYFSELTYLSCPEKNLTSLDVSANLKLQDLVCRNNPIKQLDLKNNKDLKHLYCEDTQIKSLDLSNNLKLEEVTLSIDNLKVLDLTNQAAVQKGRYIPLRVFMLTSTHSGIVDLSNIKGLDYSLIDDPAFDAKTKKLDLGKVVIDGKYGYDLGCGSLPYEFYVEYHSSPDDPNPYLYREISYRTHIQSIGWQDYVTNGEVSGTSGQAKRLEAIEIKSLNGMPVDIQYTTHVQSYGWLPWSANGEVSGTEGEAKRLEAIKIKVDDSNTDTKFDIYYRVHAESFGWLGWAKNGEPAGTAGYGKRLEAIQILLVYKGENINENEKGIVSSRSEAYIAKPGNSPVLGGQQTSATDPKVAGLDTLNVVYRTHVQSYGWQGWKYNGQMAGTQGQAKRLEGINIKLTNKGKLDRCYSIKYRTHVQSYGWMPWVSDGEMSGTEGQAKRLEAIEIKVENDFRGSDDSDILAEYDIYYRVHAQSYGWLGWAKNGEPAGTSGYAKRLEGIQIVLVPKGGAAPANNYGGITSTNSQAYIAK